MRCKLGDLVIVINDVHQSDNNGKIGEVIGFEKSAPTVGNGVMHNAWLVRSLGQPFTFRNPIFVVTDTEGYFYDGELMPVSGLPDAQDTKQDEPICEGM